MWKYVLLWLPMVLIATTARPLGHCPQAYISATWHLPMGGEVFCERWSWYAQSWSALKNEKSDRRRRLASQSR